MELVIIPIVAFLVSVLTFFSGFGLGTILTPAFMLFFPIDLAIGLTGIVHFLNFEQFLTQNTNQKGVHFIKKLLTPVFEAPFCRPF